MNKTMWAVILFLIVLLTATFSMRSNADEDYNGARISLGHTVANSSMTTGEVSYEYNNWEAGYTLVGEGETKRGYQDQSHIYSLSYVVRPDWEIWNVENYYRLGVSYQDGNNLVGDTNFRLGVGLQWRDVVQLEYTHYSSAGIHDPNTGIDMIQLRYMIPSIW